MLVSFMLVSENFHIHCYIRARLQSMRELEDLGERRGRVKSRNPYKGTMDKENGGRDLMWDRSGESNGGKWGQV